ncbi:MAG: aminotransferase class V-fold PLP-dependent enzyme [Thermomicrobiales bacterium]
MPGRHFLQIPGPTNVPERILRAMDRPVPDHRGPEMPELVAEIVAGLRYVFQTEKGEIALYPGSGTGAWEAALVNTLSPGDRVLAPVIGHFSNLWAEVARAMGLQVDALDLPWEHGVPADLIREQLAADTGHGYKAVLVVHNETSTGVASDVRAVRRALDETGHPALLLVDTVSSLASIDFRFDEWGVDVALTGTQKGLMLPPGTGILCIGPRALAAAESARCPRYFFDWRPVLAQMRTGYFPYTPATLLLFGMREAVRMLREEGLPEVFARHAWLAEGVRRATRAWELPIFAQNPAEYSNSLTTVVVPDDADSGKVIAVASERLNLALGVGLGKLRGRVFRIGHLGALNELEVIATLGGVELALTLAGIPVPLGAGVGACQEYLAGVLASNE